MRADQKTLEFFKNSPDTKKSTHSSETTLESKHHYGLSDSFTPSGCCSGCEISMCERCSHKYSSEVIMEPVPKNVEQLQHF